MHKSIESTLFVLFKFLGLLLIFHPLISILKFPVYVEYINILYKIIKMVQKHIFLLCHLNFFLKILYSL